MEANTLRRTLLYSAVAVVIGLLLTLVPLITLAEIKAGYNHYAMPSSLSQRMETLEGARAHFDADTPRYSAYDLEILAFSFVIALVAYVLFKRRTPHHDHRWSGPFPY